MKMKNGMYLFAATVVAGTVGLSSCSNEEAAPQDPWTGKTATVSVGVSVKTPVKRAATGAGDVNLDGTVATISDVTIVPYIGNMGQLPIVLGNIASDKLKTTYQTATIAATVNAFRVYGNVPGISGQANFSGFELAAAASTDNQDRNAAEGDKYFEYFKAPYGLYYYANTTTDGGYYKATSDEVWTATTIAWGNKTEAAVGTDNRIKIDGVKYAVGVLAVGVLDGVTGTVGDKTCFGNAATQETATEIKKWSELAEGETMQLTGIVIGGQPEKMDAVFAQTGEVQVFAAASSAEFQANKLSFGEGDWNGQLTGANIYSVVAPEDADKIMVNFQFQNKTGKYLYLNNGDVVAPDAYAYYTTYISKKDQNIFSAGVTTLLNGTITDWGNGTLDIPEESEVQIGVEIETAWAKGIVYDEKL